jgi:hypothetical protein
MARGRLRHVTLTAAAPAPRFVAFEQLGRRPPTGLVLAIDEGERLPVGVAHDEARGGFFDGPGRREAAGLVVPRVWQPLFPLGCCRSSVKIFAVPRNMALVFPIRLTGGINDRPVISDTSPPTSLKLPRDSVGDWGRTSRALPTIKWNLA